jgi:PilZ domain
MGDETNRRDFTRVTTGVGAEIIVGGRTTFGTVQDVSLNGVFVQCSDSLPVGSQCGVNIILQGTQAPMRVSEKGRVTRANDTGMAIEFDEVDVDSFAHLRNLVLFNAPDATAIEEEFEESVGIRHQDSSA